MDRVQLKSMAKEQIKGKIWNLLAVMLIIYVIIWAASLILGMIPYVGALLGAVVVMPMTISLIRIYLAVVNEDKKPQIADAFGGYDDAWSAIKVSLLVTAFTYLWSLLFIVPGIIKYCSYSQAYYILAENKGMSAIEAINRSKAMMEGHKMDFFILGLSFIGWGIVGLITLGVAYIWIMPYMQATYTNFYNSIKPKV